MNGKNILILVIAVVLVVVGFWWWSSGEKQIDSPEVVVSKFIDNFLLAAPPTGDQSAAELARDLLSVDALTSFNNDLPIASNLAMVVGVQDLPTDGYEIIQITEGEDNVIVETHWRYSGGDTVRDFKLILENGGWKIDQVIPGPFVPVLSDSPEKTVGIFYDWYLAQETSPLGDQSFRESNLLTTDFKSRVGVMVEEGINFDPFLCAQDKPQSLSITEIEETEDMVIVPISFNYYGNEKSANIKVIRTDNHWLLDDVICD